MSEHPRLHSIPGGREERPAGPAPRSDGEPLWREVLGTRLRALRKEQQETLAETAGRAGVSPQYLSEIERGRKEPSSEMIAALAGALGTSLGELTGDVAESLRRRHVHRLRPADRLVVRPSNGSAVPHQAPRTPRTLMLAA
ncbi:helix-turn-helix transcriptional regulator [Nocardia cyriacigeorgica]|uniref:Helix-turn-helix transcriptional regulator n=1 Tax=Nocardia cyriacigeorgica TaxID=135487 RepID=A0A6P1D123_9NOCA|nr:helix-turn-helix transcriptional regulator [Nocardia cyriacigeorgica]NEW40706.1 helix-turn-helix transcriptional regulator [Nocardia cyriacigeorgica]NEW44047.1 helix-turn-helix transcriptional regulator [Nocardia cyriacigeorgica]NEW51066.1 helix-turn-helix transcriptional regulator [Nocardia cyriacigeorgica]NEW54350.1 helix-turn-helix transcriptional regulator [Nocardia cyriacigeorgica]